MKGNMMKLSVKFNNNCANGMVMTIMVSEVKAAKSIELLNVLTMYKRATGAHYGITPLETAYLLTQWADIKETEDMKFKFEVVNTNSVMITLCKRLKHKQTVLIPKINEDGLKTGVTTVRPKDVYGEELK